VYGDNVWSIELKVGVSPWRWTWASVCISLNLLREDRYQNANMKVDFSGEVWKIGLEIIVWSETDTEQIFSIGSSQISSILMICTGQRSTASRAQSFISAGGLPWAISPLNLNFSITWLNESSGFCSKKPGQVSQQDPQLMQLERSIMTFMDIQNFAL